MTEDVPTHVANVVPLGVRTPSNEAGTRPTAGAGTLPVWFDSYPHIPGYEIESELGRGGMGVVYKAWQLRLNRPVALKTLRGAAAATPADVARFLAEAEAVAAVKHPNVVQVFECGTTGSGYDGQPYMALELVTGGTLARLLLEHGALAPCAAAELVAAITGGVQAVHDAGIVHRDLKPANILLGKDEGGRMKDERKPDSGADSSFILPPSSLVPKVTDFGVARRGGSDLTATGMAVGTPEYMAPEQAAGRSKFVGPGADVWALGVILFQCLTGRTPFQGEDFYAITNEVLNKPTPWVRRLAPAVSRDLERICHKCLEKEPHHRYASAQELADDLRRFLDGKPVAVRPLGPVSRVWRAGRRNPTFTGLIAAIVLSSALGTAVSLVKADDASRSAANASTEAERARTQEEVARREADTARAALSAMRLETDARLREANARKAADTFALRTARVALYSREVGDAWRALAAGDVPLAGRALAACAPEVRGWEWRLLNRRLELSSPVLPPVTGPFMPQRLAVSPDGRWVAACGLPKSLFDAPSLGGYVVWVWDLKTGGAPVRLNGTYAWPPRTLAFGSNSNRLVAASDDALRVWDVTTGAQPVLEVLRTPAYGQRGEPPARSAGARLHADRVTAVITSADSKAAAKLVTWSLLKKGEPTEVKLEGSEGTTHAAIAPDGKSLLLVVGEGQRSVRRVAADGKLLGGPVPLDAGVRAVAFATNGVGAVIGMVTAIDRCELAAWDGTSAKLNLRTPLQGSLETMEVRPDGRVLASVHPGGLWVWEPLSGVAEVPAQFGLFAGAAAFPDSRRLVVGDFATGVRVWNPMPVYDRALTHPVRFPISAFSGERMAVADPARPHVLVRMAGKDELAEHTPDPTANSCAALAWGGNRLAMQLQYRDRGPAVLLYDPATRKVVRRWELPRGTAQCPLAADRDWVAFGSPPERGGETIAVYNAHTGALAKRLRVPADGASPLFLAFSPDGTRLAATRISLDIVMTSAMAKPVLPAGRITVWNLQTGAILWDALTIAGPTTPAFSADSTLITVPGWAATVSVLRAADGTRVRELAVPAARRPDPGGATFASVHHLAFAPDGARVAGAGSDGVTLWDLATGQVVLAIPAPASRVGFSPDGQRLYASESHKVVVYDAGPR